jgi:hypothetical protein
MRSCFQPLGIFLFAALSTNIFGQDTASLTGTVTDPTDAIIKDAQVIVENPTNGVYRVTGTNITGEYLVDGLPPAPYDLGKRNISPSTGSGE